MTLADDINHYLGIDLEIMNIMRKIVNHMKSISYPCNGVLRRIAFLFKEKNAPLSIVCGSINTYRESLPTEL